VSVEEKLTQFFGDSDPTGFGTGWWSGVLATFFGLLALGGVICFHFPQILSAPDLRQYYPVDALRIVLECTIVAAMIFGFSSALLRKKKILGFTGILLALLASLLGGASVQINGPVSSSVGLGLDYFLLDTLLTALVFSPMEVLWPAYPKQSVFRKDWFLDVGYFLSTHLPTQITSFLILLPATQLTKYFAIPALQTSVASLPLVVQFLLAVLVADLAEYWIHRSFHQVPFLWRFHSIHHSSKALDWLAGSRAHIIEDLIIRGGMLIPMMFIFSQPIILAYLIFVTFHATWTHANFAPTMKWLEKYLIQPRFHHWHHTSQAEAIDKNFAIHFPWIDKIFGTYYFPNESWPDTYGLAAGEVIPDGFWKQTLHPFTRKK
jgi:sterol desaturase/sphingolipid hydroxylase (fatty acid hydroxylase superfamily)